MLTTTLNWHRPTLTMACSCAPDLVALTVCSMRTALRTATLTVTLTLVTTFAAATFGAPSRPVAPGPTPIRNLTTEYASVTNGQVSYTSTSAVTERICRPVTLTAGRTRTVCKDITFTTAKSKTVRFCATGIVNGRKITRCQLFRLTPRVAPTTEPTPAPAPTETPVIYPFAPEGSYKFSELDPKGEPVRFDRCKVVKWSVYGADDEIELTRAAIRELEAATGFAFREVAYDGYRPVLDPMPSTPTARTGIVIRWDSESDIDDLAGDVAGVTQSLSWTLADRTWRSFSAISLESTGETLARTGGNSAWAVLLHELGHSVGLAHVDDRAQLMFPTTWDGTADRYQQGDLAGLARVGRGNARCS